MINLPQGLQAMIREEHRIAAVTDVTLVISFWSVTHTSAHTVPRTGPTPRKLLLMLQNVMLYINDDSLFCFSVECGHRATSLIITT